MLVVLETGVQTNGRIVMSGRFIQKILEDGLYAPTVISTVLLHTPTWASPTR